MRYAFIQGERSRYPLTMLYQVLQVSRSGYHAFLKQAPPIRDQALRAEGVSVGRWRIRTLMRLAGIHVKPKRPWVPRTTDSR